MFFIRSVYFFKFCVIFLIFLGGHFFRNFFFENSKIKKKKKDEKKADEKKIKNRLVLRKIHRSYKKQKTKIFFFF